jgi:hypothetical protein
LFSLWLQIDSTVMNPGLHHSVGVSRLPDLWYFRLARFPPVC